MSHVKCACGKHAFPAAWWAGWSLSAFLCAFPAGQAIHTPKHCDGHKTVMEKA